MPIRRFSAVALMAACLLASTLVAAQPFPSKPVKLVLPQPAGAGPDAIARALADELGRDLGQPVIVENRPGANGSLAAAYVVSQPADGHTLFLAGVSNMAWNPFLYKQLPYVPTRDFVGVGLVANTAFVTVASPSLGVKTLSDLVKRAKAEPGKLNFASVGIGNSTHLATELLMSRTGITMQHVPFSGAGGSTPYTSLISGDTQVMTSVPSDLVPLSKADRVIPLAVTGDERLAQLPDVPTFKELGIEMNVPGWYSVVARSGTPAAVIQRLNAAINKALKGPKIHEALAAQLLTPTPGAPQEVERLTKRDSDTWGPIIDRLNIAK